MVQSRLILSSFLRAQLAFAHGLGGLTILTQNDLENDPAPGSGAILIDGPHEHAEASKACSQISESLWVGEGDASYAALTTSLKYQAYQGHHGSHAKFWVASGKGCKCQAIETDGSLHQIDCSTRLPVLCSQSAPVSNASFEDTSPSFQITQAVGKAQYTGYRDFFTWKFRGVRYAPTPKRFEYSTPLRGVSGSISALEAGADCLQPRAPDSSEDCLFLNIWTPYLPSSSPRAESSTKSALKPVFLYIYGGNFVDGSGKNPYLDLTNIASRGDVVAVSLNHRMGNLGMLVFNDSKHNGNIAINDQISALKWIAENIEAFGGDPKRVTIAGESSGAMSTKYLIASPEAKGLYAGALMQSDGNGGVTEPNGLFWSKEQSYGFFTQNVLKDVGCAGAEDEVVCLREVPGQKLANLDINNATAKYPVIDGKYLNTPHLLLDGSGPRYGKNIPLLTGGTRDEAALFDWLHDIPWDFVTFEMWLGVLYDPEYRDFLRINPDNIYANLPLWGVGPQSKGPELFNATVSILSNNMVNCLDRAKAWSGAKNHVFDKVYSFNFHRTYSPPSHPHCQAPATPDHPFGDPSLPYYRCHGGTHVLMLGNHQRVGMPDRDGLDQDFSRLIVDYWSAFVRTGDPNPAKAYLATRGYASTLAQVNKVGKWAKVDPKSPEWMILEWDGSMAPFGEEEVCAVLGQPLDFWET